MNRLQTNSQQANQYKGITIHRPIGCIVVQGVSKREYIEEIKRGWEGFQLIFSTWEDTDKSLYEEGDIVLYNPYPTDRGVANLDYNPNQHVGDSSKQGNWVGKGP